MTNLVVNVLVAAVMMATLVVGPFYLTFGLGLAAPAVGLTMSVGPAVSILTGVPSGRIVDRWGSRPVATAGLAMLALGSLLMSVLPMAIGLAGYVVAVLVLTPGYQMFQAGNNTAALADVPANRRGLISGLLNLSRNTGLILGASAMGAVFAMGVGAEDFANASADALSHGMRLTFVVASATMTLALLVAVLPRLKRGDEATPASRLPETGKGGRPDRGPPDAVTSARLEQSEDMSPESGNRFRINTCTKS